MTLNEAHEIAGHAPTVELPGWQWPLGATRAPEQVVRIGMEGDWPASEWARWNEAADILDADERCRACGESD